MREGMERGWREAEFGNSNVARKGGISVGVQ